MGFVNINIPTSLILAGLLGYLISNIVKEDTTKVFGAVIAGGIGVILGGLIFQGGGLATALIFGLGMWFGVTLGSLPVGLLILGLGLLGGVAIFGVGAWLTSWLGLWLGFILGLVPNLMGEGINDREAYQHRAWYFWWPNQPLVSLVQQALLTAQNYYISDLELKRVWRKALPSLTPQKNKKTNPNDLISVLQYGHWLERLVARWGLIDLGGEAVPPLQQLLAQNRLECQEKVMDLLTSIEQETTVRLAGRLSYLLCPHCLARFGGHTVTVSWGISFTYYGCRRCQQSREFSEIAQVVVVLDNTWTEPHFQQEGRLLVNWLQRRTLFDFDSVLIGQASDEQIERFAVQVGNDTDPIHQFYYRRMTCSVKNSSNLSENTLRILQRMFRAVKFLKTA
jgi:hypothetical protein